METQPVPLETPWKAIHFTGADDAGTLKSHVGMVTHHYPSLPYVAMTCDDGKFMTWLLVGSVHKIG